MVCLGLWGASAVLLLLFACTAAKRDDTMAPLTVLQPFDPLLDNISYHIAHFGSVPYGTFMDGYALSGSSLQCAHEPETPPYTVKYLVE